ncbi:MAG TPA: PKD domain-containing protein [Thermoanaerobaculia bacterium]|jgi:PKD repeat protein|nr:PKD domain-containing protein [Thermoanaerobaculia bacterium]
MTKPRSRAENLVLSTLALLALPVLLLVAHPAEAAQTCDHGLEACPGRLACASPATPAPQSLWGDLQPADVSLPAARDTTNFSEFRESYPSRNWFYGVDIENGWVLAGLAHGIGIWDARTDPANPTFVAAKRYGASTGFPFIPPGESEKIVFGGIDAPDDTVAAVAGYNGAGILVFNLSNKADPKPIYQNADKTAEAVYATKIGNTRYAFLAATTGLFVYNLDAALTFNGCKEDADSPNACPGVRVGQIQTAGTPRFVHGAGNYLVVSFGSSSGFQIFDVSNPASPQLKLTGLSNRFVNGVALWNEGLTYYLGARLGKNSFVGAAAETSIFDVSCITTSCSGLGPALKSLNLDSASTTEYLTFSRSGVAPFLYVGSDAMCASANGEQREWLLDVSNPAAAHDVTPQAVMQVTGPYNGATVTKPVNYWSWYYRGSMTGFNLVMPRAGKFIGDYFYRAGRSIFDIHKITLNAPPVSDFAWSPLEVYPGTPVTFADQSSGAPTGWQWTFQDGSPFTAVTAGPQVTFNSVGPKTVTLTANNNLGPGNTKSKTVTVLDPTPVIGQISASPASPKVCQPVTLSASGVQGQPTLFYQWKIDSQNFSNGTQPVWDTTSVTPGDHTVSLDVSNTGGTANKSIVVNVAALSPLPGNGSFTPANDAFTDGTVQFHVTAAGATEWRWDFGDGAGFGNWTNDPVNGPNPLHVYTSIGDKAVKVQVRNCQNLAGAESAPLSIHISQTTPLVASFQAGVFCQFGQCFATVGQSVPFADSSTGAQFWDYDWTHNSTSAATCNFTDNDHTSPVTSHTFTLAGDVYPCLRVRRGASEQNVLVHGRIIVETGAPPPTPSIAVSGPSSGQINQAYTFTASASNCSANSSGWTWTIGGGGSGSSTTSSIAVTWTTTGSKTVSATNSGCGTAQGNKNVNITDPGNPGPGDPGTLAANFTFAPAAPGIGQTVTFDGSSSTGSPGTYAWDFGDGSVGEGKIATHSYAAGGSYTVRLTVATSGCLSAACFRDTTKTVVVSGPPPPPPVSAAFTANVECINVGGFDQCQANTGQTVTLTADVADATSYSWTFGDEKAGANSRTVTHSWAQPGSYLVSLTVIKDQSTATKTRTFLITGAPVPTVKSVVLPWIAQTRGALVQSSDLYVHNPGAAPMEVTLEFRKRGAPESNPPRSTQTIQPGATLYVGDVLRELFSRENVAGFISVRTEGEAEPVITSFNTTFTDDGLQFGQTVAGVSMSHLQSEAAKSGESRQHLVGLIDNSERLAYFGISNPGDQPATYHLRFFDKTGKQIGESSADLSLSRLGQRQFQEREIREDFGVSNVDDYRVEIETKSGGLIIPYASNLRAVSADPSFIEPGSSRSGKVYLVGALSAPGLNNSLWQTDVLLSNISDQPATVEVRFTSLGINAKPTSPLRVTLPAGKTERLANVISGQLGVPSGGGGIGVLTITSTSSNGVFPIVQGESYESTNDDPAERFGQSMTAVSDEDAAGAGQVQYLVGLRQDAKNRTTFWLFNPGSTTAEYDVVYRGLDGKVLGTTAGVKLGAGVSRQFGPGQHPLPAAGVADGFTVQIVVKSGKVLSAAQVINNLTNDPAYIQGEVR